MNAEKWLDQVKMLDQLIDAKLAERDRLMSIATDVSAKPITDMPIDHGGTVAQKMQDAVCALVDLASELNQLIDRYIDLKKEVVAALEKLPVKHYTILHCYYIRYMSLGQIADKMGYSKEHICREKRKAVYMLGKVIECQW